MKETPRSMNFVCQKKLKIYFELDVESDFPPQLHISIRTSGTKSRTSYVSRTFQKTNHQFLFVSKTWHVEKANYNK